MRKRLGYILGMASILFAAIVLRIYDPAPVAQTRALFFDFFQRSDPRVYNPDAPVRVVDIDEESLRRIGQWPWPRTVMAQLVQQLVAQGAATIAFDVVFSEPDRTSPENSLKFLPRSEETEKFIRNAANLPSYDRVFAQTLAEAPVVMGLVLNNDAASGLPEAKAAFAHAGDDPRQFVPEFGGILRNLEDIEKAGIGLGSLNWTPDIDQTIRRVPMLLRVGDRLFPSLSAEALRVAQGASTFIVKSSNASGEQAYGSSTGLVSLKIGAFEVPTDHEGQVWLKFTRHEPRRFIPVWKVLAGEADPNEINGRIIIIGTSAAGLFDLRTTPLDASVPGVEVHAQALEQIMSGNFLIRPDYALALEIFYMVLVGVMLAVLILWVGAEWSAVLGLSTIVAIMFASWYVFTRNNLLLDPLYPSLVAGAIYVFGTLSVYLRSESERRQVRSAFSRYMSPDLVAKLADDPSRLVLGGEMRDMTLMFCDIRGFTGISEGLDAEDLTRLVNRFLTPMTDIILREGGTIDKYMGDCIMAFWNAPLDDDDHARHACRASLEMMDALEDLNRSLESEARAEGRPHMPIRIGIGVSTGECCVGNMGSDQRFDYSVIGDNVNVASRLEGQSKTYGQTVVVNETTVEQVDGFAFVELDLISVKGKERAVRIYTILGDESVALDPRFADLVAVHERMLSAYRGRRWDEAAAALDECSEKGFDSLTGLYDLYRQRLEVFRHDPPPADWDGSYVALTK